MKTAELQNASHPVQSSLALQKNRCRRPKIALPRCVWRTKTFVTVQNECRTERKQFSGARLRSRSKTANFPSVETSPSTRPIGRGLAHFLHGRFAVPGMRVR